MKTIIDYYFISFVLKFPSAKDTVAIQVLFKKL